MKITPLGSEMFHTDGRTDRWSDMTMLIVAFSNFANAPKNDTSISRFLCNSQLILYFRSRKQVQNFK